MQSATEIRRKKEALRKQTMKTLKFPRVFSTKKPIESPVSVVQKPIKLDKRCFANVYQLNEKIGEGANGVVHKCTQIKSQQLYAVKVLEGDQQYVRIVKQTYQILKYFDNDSIIKGKCCFINENTQQIYLVMEYCPYPSLAKTMQESQLSEQNIKTIMLNLLQSVNLLHQSFVCHRDLKPQNILINTHNNKIKIIDFGISKALYNKRTLEKETMWTVTGSQYYKAPEMLNGSQYDEKVDVWALGVIAYQLIFGKLPFYSQYLGEVIEQILSEQPDYHNEHVTTLDIDFIKALLRKDPKQRLSCAQALRHPWIENQIRFKKSDDLSSSQYIFMKNDFSSHFNRKLSPTSSTLVINHNTVNINDLIDPQTGIFQIRKDMDISNWLSLRNRSNSVLPSSYEDNSLKQNACSIEFQINMVGLDS